MGLRHCCAQLRLTNSGGTHGMYDLLSHLAGRLAQVKVAGGVTDLYSTRITSKGIRVSKPHAREYYSNRMWSISIFGQITGISY